MCAIFFSLGFEDISSTVIDSVAHRGPDGKGWQELCSPYGPVIIAHRRLSIIDLSSDGIQPMQSDSRYWITFNGEIYNYKDLRRELVQMGIIFKTQTDTEVLLNGFIVWGKTILNKLNGMFAFAIWDDKEKTLFAARDRFGVKPLFYYVNSKRIALASEIKQLLNISDYKRSINADHLNFYIVNNYHPLEDTTLFKDIQHVPPGHYLEFNGNKTNVTRWYFGNDYVSKQEDPKIEFVELLTDAVSKRLISDVPTGGMLSGGLDSSSIVCLVSDLINKGSAHKDFRTFTSWSPDPLVNERIYSDSVVAKTKLPNHLAEITDQSLQNDIADIIYHQEEPFISTSVQSEWNVYKTIKKETNLKVVLDGQGADELLCGYLFMIPYLLSSYVKKGNLITALSEFYQSIKMHANLRPKALMFETMTLISPNTVRILQALRGKQFSSSNIHKFSSFNDYTRFLIKRSIEPQLRWQDRSSMAFGIESRQPFLDYRIVEFLLTLDEKLKFKNGKTKVILRDSMQDIVPPSILNRVSKFGFPSPQTKLLNNLDKRYFSENLSLGMECINKIGSYNHDYFKSYTKHGIIHERLFFPFTLGLWLEKFELNA